MIPIGWRPDIGHVYRPVGIGSGLRVRAKNQGGREDGFCYLHRTIVCDEGSIADAVFSSHGFYWEGFLSVTRTYNSANKPSLYYIHRDIAIYAVSIYNNETNI